MTKTFTPTNLKNLSKPEAFDQQNQDDQKFYDGIKQQLDKLYREPSAETIAKILSYAKKR
ncbi:hypothetical protein SAMN06297358_2454 [Pedobacter xixiisoli]|uniref:Uncharacterized protein n=2 Tax=Pedobacter xixiisoli TaxID=1476464 RepID=A0A286A0N1_9SPHI|nr:hypothetical protein SAMN06297358_2454 [Pedobacter xixiisoli]